MTLLWQISEYCIKAKRCAGFGDDNDFRFVWTKIDGYVLIKEKISFKLLEKAVLCVNRACSTIAMFVNQHSLKSILKHMWILKSSYFSNATLFDCLIRYICYDFNVYFVVCHDIVRGIASTMFWRDVWLKSIVRND